VDPEEVEELLARITQEVLEEYEYNGPPVIGMTDIELEALYEMTSPELISEIDARFEEAGGSMYLSSEEDAVSMVAYPVGRAFVGLVKGAPSAVAGAVMSGTRFGGRAAALLARHTPIVRGLLPDQVLTTTGRYAAGAAGTGRWGLGGGPLGAAGRTGAGTAAAANAGFWGSAAGSTGWLRSALGSIPKPKTLQAIAGLSPATKRLLTAGVGATALGGYLGTLMPEQEDAPLPEAGDVSYDEEGQIVQAGPGEGGRSSTAATADTLTARPMGQQMYNSLFWENHTIQSANDKYINLILGKSIPVGVGLSQAMSSYGGRYENIRHGPGRASFENHILSNWENYPRFQMAVLSKLNQRIADFHQGNDWRSIAGQGGVGTAAGAAVGMIRGEQSLLESPMMIGDPLSSEHMAIVQAMLTNSETGTLFPFDYMGGPSVGQTGPQGGYAQALDQLEALDTEFGTGSSAQALSGIIDSSIAEYVDEYTKTNQTMLTYADPMGGGMTGYLTEFDLTENSFDGTPGGAVFTLMDAFSGPYGLKVGPQFNRQSLEDQFNRTQVDGTSPLIAQLQQSLYSMGKFVDPRDGQEYLPAVWGVVDDLTVNALDVLQADMARNYARAVELGIDPDINKIYMEIQNASTAEQMAGSDVPNPESIYRAKVINDVKTGIDRALANRGVSVRPGSDIYADTVKHVLDSLTPGERETAWGQGGSPEDRAGALHLLDGITGGDYSEFGHMNNDQMFMNYANKVGALSPDEMTKISRSNTEPGHLDQLRAERGKDVWVSNFLMTLGKPVREASQQEIRNALTMTANTIGMGIVGRAGMTAADIQGIADRGYNSLYQAPIDPASENLMDTLEGRVSNAMNVQGQGMGGARYSNLLGVLDKSFTTQRARV